MPYTVHSEKVCILTIHICRMFEQGNNLLRQDLEKLSLCTNLKTMETIFEQRIIRALAKKAEEQVETKKLTDLLLLISNP